MTEDIELSVHTDRQPEPVTDGGRDGGQRQPAVAGRFYAGTAPELREQLASCFRDDHGPGPLDGGPDVSGVTALVSPHAGYPYSGPVAAHGFGALASAESPETAVIVGPNHDGRGVPAAVAPHARWKTPLGPAEVDERLASAIVERSEVATVDERPHAGEHSIEVQLPFLQYVLDEVSVVPVCLTRPGPARAVTLGEDVVAAIERTGRDVVVVSSTDLTHYRDHRTAVTADEPILDAIDALDTDAIAGAVEDGHSMCGPWSTVVGLTAARELGAHGAELVRYATSGETAGGRERVVGYCSAVLD